jgi:membrane fusion protein, copper/silver efflux system
MKLVPIKAASAGTEARALGQAGLVPVEISPAKQQRIGLATTTVGKRRLVDLIRATGVLEHDETVRSTVAPRFAGYVTQLYANFTGQEITRGDPLVAVYSPDVMVSELEFLLALRQEKNLGAQAGPEERASAKQLVDSARQRLRLWGISDEEVRQVEARGEPGEAIVLRAPVSGHVLSKTAVVGKAFMAGQSLYEIGELSRLWVRVSVPENQFSRVRPGQGAKVVLPYLGHREVDSTVEFIYPHIDPATRRGEIRLALDNPRHELRPDMWANVEIEVDLGTVLAIPASAVMDTGQRLIAFAKGADGRLVPRELNIGARTDALWEVLKGVEAGDEVVTRALFLVDAESQLEAALQGMTAGQSEEGHGH